MVLKIERMLNSSGNTVNSPIDWNYYSCNCNENVEQNRETIIYMDVTKYV